MSEKSKKPRFEKSKILSFLVAFVVGGGIGFLVAHFALGADFVNFDPRWYHKTALIPLLVFTLFLVIGIHELGHVLAGFTQRFEFRFISVGPFMVEKELGRKVFKWNSNFNTFGGLALCLPKDDVNLSKRFAIFSAGGPLASILSGFVALLILIFSPVQVTSFFTFLLDALLVTFTVISFAIGIITSIPMHSGGFVSDGGRIVNLLSKGPKSEIEAVLLSCISKGTAGVRPALYDPEPLLKCIAFEVDSPMKPYLHSLLYNHYHDIKDLEKASFHLEEYLKAAPNLPEGYVAVLYLEKAWFEARFHKNATLAKSFYHKEKIGAIVPKSLVYRAEAAIAYAEDDKSLAQVKIDEAIAQLPKLIDKGAAIAEKEWLEELREELY